MGVETLGEAGSLGLRIVAQCVRGREDGPARGRAGSAPIDGNWIWRRSYAREAELFHCRASKADCGAHGAATDDDGYVRAAAGPRNFGMKRKRGANGHASVSYVPK
jgi:hypothetical protein